MTGDAGREERPVREVRRKIAALMELPGDVLLDVARLSLVGDMELLIENHRGLTEYTTSQIRMHTPQGEIEVTGEELQIGSLSPDAIAVVGRIRQIRYL